MSENATKLLHAIERRQFIDGLRHDATRQGVFEKSMWHLDHPVPGTNLYLKPSDHGAGAAALYAAVETMPRWQKLWLRARAELPPNGRRVLDALLVDWRSRPAARIAGVSQPTVDKWKKLFQKFSPNVFGPGNAISGKCDFSLFHEISLGYMGDVRLRERFPSESIPLTSRKEGRHGQDQIDETVQGRYRRGVRDAEDP